MPTPRPVTVPRFVAAKRQGRRLAVLTAYDFLTAKLMDAAGVDALLVGDTLGTVVQGRPNTLSVTVDEMIYHTAIVARAARRALVIADLPFLSYQPDPITAVRNAGRIVKESGAAAVKLEGGGLEFGETIAALVRAGIPTVAHVGLKPQSVHVTGGYRVDRDADRLVADAVAAERAGAFCVLLELVPRSAAAAVTRAVSVPTVGIGAGPECDGQVLVGPDMLGLNAGFEPKFLKRYADLAGTITDAVERYVAEVREGTFPADGHSHE